MKGALGKNGLKCDWCTLRAKQENKKMRRNLHNHLAKKVDIMETKKIQGNKYIDKQVSLEGKQLNLQKYIYSHVNANKDV